MSIDTGISSGPSEIFTIPVRNMLPCLRISKSLCQSEINNVNIMLLLANSYKEIVRFDISV